jgi:hypothetical protein
VQDYNQEAWNYNSWKAQLESQLNSWEAEYTLSESSAVYKDDVTQGWTQPAPESPHPHPVQQPGSWQPSGENFGGFSKEYQEFITGHPISDAYKVNGVKFDGFSDGSLIEVKGHYGQFVDAATGEFQDWWAGSNSGGLAAIEQAFRQFGAAGGNPVRWVVADPEAVAAFRLLLENAGITGISITVGPPLP